MSQTNVIPTQKIQDAAAGNQQLLDLLTALAATTNLQQQVTSTTGKNVPPQVKATVSYLKGNYIVEIQNPGSVSPVSAVQSAQVSSGATTSTNNAPITPLYHQIRVATSPQFNISSNVTTFGGTTGSTQTYWTLTNLGSGNFYFQIRSSFDGINFNLWRNANGGQSITSRPEGVTIEQTTNGAFGLFALPGQQLVAFGLSLASNGDTYGVPTELYTSAMQVIAGPNGFQIQTSNLAHGILTESISLAGDINAVAGPPDFPTVVNMTYEDGEGHVWPGTANIFSFCYDPLGANVVEQTTTDGIWVDFVLPGGAHLSIGSGVTADGAVVVMPSTMPWVRPATMLSIVSPNSGIDPSRQARGITEASIDAAGTMHCQFQDTTSNAWSSTGNWFAVGFSPGIPQETVVGGKWVILTTPSGTKVAIGAGSGANGSSFGLPTGFTPAQMFAIPTPAGADATSHPMAGVYQCEINVTTLNLLYTDTIGSFWSGDLNWFAFAWQ
jgi:hypothetical protein